MRPALRRTMRRFAPGAAERPPTGPPFPSALGGGDSAWLYENVKSIRIGGRRTGRILESPQVRGKVAKRGRPVAVQRRVELAPMPFDALDGVLAGRRPAQQEGPVRRLQGHQLANGAR